MFITGNHIISYIYENLKWKIVKAKFQSIWTNGKNEKDAINA